MVMIRKSCWTLLALLLLCACQVEKNRSQAHEGTDTNNSFRLLAREEPPTYDELMEYLHIKTDRMPWTDSYWPFTEKGLARRWDAMRQTETSANGIWPAAFFRTHLEASYSPLINPLLSPAEKYDVVYRWRHGVILDPVSLLATVDTMQTLQGEIESRTTIDEKRLGVSQLANLFALDADPYLRKAFPLSHDGWNFWLGYTSKTEFRFLSDKDSGDDWSWMGYCHGWAPAALMHEAPRHAVLVRFGGQELLFTEGDIRGLLTRAWSDFWPSDSMYFVGRRCNRNLQEPQGEIPHGASGRGYYGMLRFLATDPELPFYVNSEYFAAFSRSGDRIYPVLFEEAGRPSGFLLERAQGANRFLYVFAETIDEIRLYVEKGEQSPNLRFPSLVELYGCWDVNPATFHATLIEKLGKQKIGVVIDRTRTGQVWNQPVYEAEFTISGLKLASTTPDVAALYRAPGTKYLAEVKAKVKWLSEPVHPRMDYAETFEKRYVVPSRYTYTLEFDRQKRLIGGEWGTLDGIDPKQVVPDFLYGFDQGAVPRDDLDKGFDYSGIIAKLHACSIKPEADGAMDVAGQSLPYTFCELTSALLP